MSSIQDKRGYGVRITGDIKSLNSFVCYYRSAERLLTEIVLSHYRGIETLDPNERFNAMEKIIHSAEKGKYKRDSEDSRFDNAFPDFLVYYRRAALRSAIGKVSAYKKQIALWKRNGKKGRMPQLCYDSDSMPPLYEGTYSFGADDKGFFASIKVYTEKKKWHFERFRLESTDLFYIYRHVMDKEPVSPVLQEDGRGMKLQILFSGKAALPDSIGIICSVDIGINYPAVTVIMDSTGRIRNKLYVRSGHEEAMLRELLNRIRGVQSTGTHNQNALWRKAKNYNEALAIRTVREIVEFAVMNHADCIVAEHLDADFGKSYCRDRAQRLRLWRKRDVIERLERSAHGYGMRFETVNPANTSKLYYKGGGEIKRDEHDMSKAKAPDGKMDVQSDFNAAVNIGARFFLRQMRRICTIALKENEEDPPYLKATKEEIRKELKRIKGYTKQTEATMKTFRDALPIIRKPTVYFPDLFRVDIKTPTDFISSLKV